MCKLITIANQKSLASVHTAHFITMYINYYRRQWNFQEV